MRFNDLLRTVLANDGEGIGSAVTRWRQCIDLVAQYDVSGATPAHKLTEEDAVAIFRVLAELRPRLGAEQRVASIVELGGRLRSVRLCRFLAQDHPAVVSAVMARARLVDEDWAAIIPALGPLARSILRRRADMGPGALAILDRFGPTDLALPAAVTPPLSLRAANTNEVTPALQPEEPSEIRKIVERIERFTATRTRSGAAQAPDETLDLALEQAVDPLAEPISAFSFETDEKGRFIEVDGAPRGALIGLGVGQAAIDGLSGADGQALGAFRRRAAFRDARFAIADGLLSGEWRISAEPRFDRASGIFLGYDGSARRELPHEQIVKSPVPAHEWAGLSAAGARQLIHELRTPLSAIYAYAEMIEGQLVGPVSVEYRDIAKQIIADARELVATFDDLDLAGRIARDDDRRAPDMIDVAAVLRALVPRFGQGGHRVSIEANGALPPVWGDREQMDRMFSHLIRAGCAALSPGEPLTVQLRHLPVTHTLSIAIQRPIALRGLTEATLLDHGSSVDLTLSSVPPLGLAFTLRLVRGIAARAGGQFLLSADAFELVLPAAGEDMGGRERGH